jgi:tRNA-Thr(GGU) m(6)t(6)A37 methyltransferase TsaA
MSISIDPIGVIHTPYKQKFAIPRQPGLVKSAIGEVHFTGEFNDANYLRGIEQFSHLWLLFRFHQTADQGHTPLVRPPRLGGNKKMGVFATRSTFRPNGIGMSVVEFVSVDWSNAQLTLRIKGMDLLDQTPILDIKPYVPYADSVSQAQGGYAQSAPSAMPVVFAPSVKSALLKAEQQRPKLTQLIEQVLNQDPRPAYKQQPEKIYAMSLYEFNIKWQVTEQVAHVLAIE